MVGADPPPLHQSLSQSFKIPECLQHHFRVWSSSLLVQFLCFLAHSVLLNGFKNYSLKTLEQAGFILCLPS